MREPVKAATLPFLLEPWGMADVLLSVREKVSATRAWLIIQAQPGPAADGNERLCESL